MPTCTEEQKKAIESIDSHVLVSAGAGSGKTFVLVERYVEILRRHPECKIEDIIAVTYTRKAAEEMRSRLKQRLRELALQGESSELKELFDKHLKEVDGARIGTIHSLCESILKIHPTEAKIDPNFQLLDELERSELMAEVMESVLNEIYTGRLPELEPLLDQTVANLKLWLSALIGSHIQYREWRLLAGDSLETFRTHAERFLLKTCEQLIQTMLENPDWRSSMSYVLDAVPIGKPGFDAMLEGTKLAIHSLLDAGISLHSRWNALVTLANISIRSGGNGIPTLKDALKTVREPCKEISEKLSLSLRPADEEALAWLYKLLQAADMVLARYDDRKKAMQKMDFDDLIDRTHHLLTQPDGRARTELANRLRALVVDEFQDTNPVQADLIQSMVGEGTRLFLIGDDKQSIYKFQGADVSTFNRKKALISGAMTDPDETPLPGVRGQLLSLSASFRSHPDVVAFVNTVFAQLFAQDKDSPDKAQHQALYASRPSTGDGPRVEINRYEDSGSGAEKAVLEGRLVAQRIKEMVAQGVTIYDKSKDVTRKADFGDFAILVPANADFQAIEEALAENSIPFVSYSGSGFLEKQEVIDMENLLRFLVSPQDSHALFAALRSPIFGISDDLLHQIHESDSSSLWLTIANASARYPEASLKHAVTVLRKLRLEAQSLCLSEVCRRILELSAYDVVLLTGPGGKQRSRNLWKFLWLAGRHNHMDIPEFLHALERMRELNTKDLSEAPLSITNAVKVMTIHKSKGLEFGIVVLPRLSKRIHVNPGKLLKGKEFGFAFDTSRDEEDDKPSYFVAANEYSRFLETEERKRLFYVALTRARDHLVLMLPQQFQKTQSVGNWLVSVLLEIDNPGAHTVGDTSATYNVRMMELKAEDQQDRSGYGDPDREKSRHPGLSDHLLRPLDIAREEIQGKTAYPYRLTPSAHERAKDPTLLGNYFHGLMSRMGTSVESVDDDLLEEVLVNELSIVLPEHKQALKTEVKGLLEIFSQSNLAAMIKESRKQFHEWSMWIVRKEDRELRPDLVLQDSDGVWHVVDYKTDHVSRLEIPKQVKTHTAQLSDYVRDLRLLLGIEARPWVYFAHTGILEPVNTTES